MRCQRCQDRLSAYLEGDLSERSHRAVTLHLSRCQTCQEELATMKRWLDELSMLPQPSAPKDGWGHLAQALSSLPTERRSHHRLHASEAVPVPASVGLFEKMRWAFPIVAVCSLFLIMWVMSHRGFFPAQKQKRALASLGKAPVASRFPKVRAPKTKEPKKRSQPLFAPPRRALASAPKTYQAHESGHLIRLSPEAMQRLQHVLKKTRRLYKDQLASLEALAPARAPSEQRKQADVARLQHEIQRRLVVATRAPANFAAQKQLFLAYQEKLDLLQEQVLKDVGP
ncbi:MAG: zf-HC2 domain-containing protein [Myxococcales bacterium]|nr:zf-HC2 domain-containing protein [Myxococcales bacterium]